MALSLCSSSAQLPTPRAARASWSCDRSFLFSSFSFFRGSSPADEQRGHARFLLSSRRLPLSQIHMRTLSPLLTPFFRVHCLLLPMMACAARAILPALTRSSQLRCVSCAGRFRSDHETHIRGARGVGIDHLLEIARPQAHADREREEVDDLLGVRAQQVRTQNALGPLLDECLEPRMRERYPP